MTQRQAWWRVAPAGLAGGAGWWIGFQALFMPAQAILADPGRQSAKFLTVFLTLPPPPKTSVIPWLLPVAFLVFGLIQAGVFHAIRPVLPRRTWLAGLAFGAIAWALCFPWFEFYLPWNVMAEPAALVGLELVLWAGTMAVAGLAIALAYETGGRRAA